MKPGPLEVIPHVAFGGTNCGACKKLQIQGPTPWPCVAKSDLRGDTWSTTTDICLYSSMDLARAQRNIVLDDVPISFSQKSRQHGMITGAELSQLLYYLTLGSDTSNRQDKVLVLVGISGLAQHESIAPDYNQNTQTTNIQTALHVMQYDIHCLCFNTNFRSATLEDGQLRVPRKGAAGKENIIRKSPRRRRSNRH